MKQIKVAKYVVFSMIGLLILGGGLAMIKLWPDVDGIVKMLPFLCVGFGAWIFGGNIGTAMNNHIALKNPQYAKQAEIEEKDERNLTIRNKAKAKVYDLLMYAFPALILAFALMGVDIYLVLTLVAVYMISLLTNVHYVLKYQKEM